MTIHDIEKHFAVRKYKNPSGDIVEFTYFSKGTTTGAVTTTFTNSLQMSGEYGLRQDKEIIYLRMGNSEFIFELKEMDDKRITAFDLIKDNEVVYSFTFIST